MRELLHQRELAAEIHLPLLKPPPVAKSVLAVWPIISYLGKADANLHGVPRSVFHHVYPFYNYI